MNSGVIIKLFFTGWGLLLLPILSLNAAVVWDATELEFQAEAGQEMVSAVFGFRVEEDPVTIKSVRTSCGCTTTRLEKTTYQPGETGTIEVHFEIGSRVGPQQKYISLQMDDSKTPTQDLVLKVYIPYILKVEPRFVYWEKGVEPYHEQFIDLTSDTELDITFTSITSDTEQLHVRWEALNDKTTRVYLQPVVPDGEAPFFRAILKVEINAPIDLKQKIFHAYAFMKTM